MSISSLTADPYLPPPSSGYEILRQVLPAGVPFTGVQPVLAAAKVAPAVIDDVLVRMSDEAPVDPRNNPFDFKIPRQVIGWAQGKIDKGGIFRLAHRRTTMRIARVVGRVSAGQAWELSLKSPQWDGSVIGTVIASSTTTSDLPFMLVNPEPSLQIRPDEYLVFTCGAGADVSWIEVHIDAAID